MTLMKEAIRAALTDQRFVARELLPAIPIEATGDPEASLSLRLVEANDRDDVFAEMGAPGAGRLFLSAFAEEREGELTYRALVDLSEYGFGEGSRYRVPQPLAYMPDFRLVVTTRPSGVSVAKLIDGRTAEAVGAIEEAGRWLARLHSTRVSIGPVWFPWRNLGGVAMHASIVSAKRSPYRGLLRDMLRRVAPLAAHVDTRAWVQTHGRFRDDCVFAGPGVITVDDFLRTGRGDPARDVAEFLVHMRMRAERARDSRAETFPWIFLDGYLTDGPERQLGNLSFYAACSVMTSLARLIANGTPSDAGFGESVDLHVDEFERHLPSRSRQDRLKPTA